MSNPKDLMENLATDLKQGVVPISRVASSLAALIKRSRANHQPIIVTQKGYPTGVILDVELFTALKQLAFEFGVDLGEDQGLPPNLSVDLKHGVVPISKVASSLAALIKRSRANHQPIIVTQKGRPTGVILDVELFTALKQLAYAAGVDIGDAEEQVNESSG